MQQILICKTNWNESGTTYFFLKRIMFCDILTMSDSQGQGQGRISYLDYYDKKQVI